MGFMNSNKNFTGEEIDVLVEEQVDDEAAWDNPTYVKRSQTAPVSLPSELAARAAFFARLHRAENVETWLQRVIQERIELEEAVFAELKRDFINR
jgi:hypothetical protein